MSICVECRLLSGRGLCDGLITGPEESYQLWCFVVCDLETSRMRRSWPTGAVGPKNYFSLLFLLFIQICIVYFVASFKLCCV